MAQQMPRTSGRQCTATDRLTLDGGPQYGKHRDLTVTHDPDPKTKAPAHKFKARAPRASSYSPSRGLDLSGEMCSARPLRQPWFKEEEEQEEGKAETQQKEVACASGGAEGKAAGAALVGTRVKVWWAVDCKWFTGRVKVYDAALRSYYIHYADGDRKWHKLDQPGEMWRLLAPAPASAHDGIGGRCQDDAGVHLLGGAAPTPPVPGAPPAPPVPPVELIDSRIRVWWTEENAWYAGRVVSVERSAGGSLHTTVAYDDNSTETHDLELETWEMWEEAEAQAQAVEVEAEAHEPSSLPSSSERARNQTCHTALARFLASSSLPSSSERARCGTFGCTLADRHAGLHQMQSHCMVNTCPHSQ